MQNLNWRVLHSYTGDNKTPKAPAVRRGRYADLALDQCAICAENASFIVPGSSYNSIDFGFPVQQSQQQQRPTIVSSTTGEDGQPLYPINIPYVASCGHVYCYYCLSEKVIRTYEDGDDAWECLRCTEPVRECHRLTAVELEESADDWNSDIDDLPSFTTDMSLDDS